MDKKYDIVIIGGGIVGLSCALSLADTPLTIALIEGKPPDFDYDKTQYDMRVVSLNPASVDFFRALGVWKTIKSERISAFNKIFIWTDDSELEFLASDIDETMDTQQTNYRRFASGLFWFWIIKPITKAMISFYVFGFRWICFDFVSDSSNYLLYCLI